MPTICCIRHLPAALLIEADLEAGQAVIAYSEMEKIVAFTVKAERYECDHCQICKAPSRWRVTLDKIKKVKDSTIPKREKFDQAMSEHAA
jgi:hypothetical protein